MAATPVLRNKFVLDRYREIRRNLSVGLNARLPPAEEETMLSRASFSRPTSSWVAGRLAIALGMIVVFALLMAWIRPFSGRFPSALSKDNSTTVKATVVELRRLCTVSVYKGGYFNWGDCEEARRYYYDPIREKRHKSFLTDDFAIVRVIDPQTQQPVRRLLRLGIDPRLAPDIDEVVTVWYAADFELVERA